MLSIKRRYNKPTISAFTRFLKGKPKLIIMRKIQFLIFLFIPHFIWACTERNPLENNQSETFDFEVVTIAEGINSPWGMAWLPDGRMLVTERSGKLYVIENDSFNSQEISNIPEVYANGQGGLLDIRIHPDYVNNGWIYMSYSKPGEGGGSTAIVRGKIENNQWTNEELLFEAMPKTRSGVHFGSRIVFDEQNYMFFSVGERGEWDNAQKLSNDHGKIHRLHDDGSVPNDNPYLQIPDARHSIWSYGHRNPQGLAFHPVSGKLWSHEHGPKGGDELNIVEKKKNYGWPEISYGINYNGEIITELTEKEGMEQPVHYWDPSIAPCGMAFVTSDKYPTWKGDILIGSLSFRYLHRVKLSGEKVVDEEELLKGIGRVRHIAESPDGYIYVAVEGAGKIVKLVPKK